MIGPVLVAVWAAAAAVLIGDLADAALGYETPVWSVVLGVLALVAGITMSLDL
jgi:hypothetical protein